MVQKAVLLAVFMISGSLLYLVSPSWGCSVEAQCTITCYNSSGVALGPPEKCISIITGSGNQCTCDTEFNSSGQASCTSHCTGQSTAANYCIF
jgi:hypothetical protein